MTITPVYIGCDISKHHLDFFDPETQSFLQTQNTSEAIEKAVPAWQGRNVLIVMEATGRHDILLRQTLAHHRIQYARINPHKVKHFAKAFGRRAKTDRLDAALLSTFGTHMQPAADPFRHEKYQYIQELHTRRSQLVKTRAEEKTRRSSTSDPHIVKSHDHMIDCLTKEIKDINDKLEEAICHDEQITLSTPEQKPATAPA